MKTFNIDEPREIGKKKLRISSKELNMVKDDLQERLEEKKNKGLWHNIHAKRKRGEKPTKPGEKGYPKTLDIDEARGTCWVGYKQVGMKKKGNRMVPNCVAEVYWQNTLGESCGYTFEFPDEEQPVKEAEYQGRKVKLGKIMQGDAKKFKVYVKNPKGNTVKVNFGQGGDAKGGTMRIRKSNPGARKSFRARHNCDSPGPRHKARYWSCRKW